MLSRHPSDSKAHVPAGHAFNLLCGINTQQINRQTEQSRQSRRADLKYLESIACPGRRSWKRVIAAQPSLGRAP
eukprot:914774-Pelagomonas_calceolata.AAC.5